MLDVLLALVMGGVVGWLASLVMNRDASMGILANVVVGCLGSVIGRFLIGALIGGGRLQADPFDWRTLVTALFGAVLLLAVANLVQRRRLR